MVHSDSCHEQASKLFSFAKVLQNEITKKKKPYFYCQADESPAPTALFHERRSLLLEGDNSVSLSE